MSIWEFFKNLFDSAMSGSFERMRIVNYMNQAFKEIYYAGEMQRLCHVTITSGVASYRHEMSVAGFRSGFNIIIQNDYNLADSEKKEIANFMLSEPSFVRQLMALGFDTLYVVDRNDRGFQYALKDHASLRDYFIE